jgi:polyvinyl alcohol dehydrogenase (cytochrome)
MMFLNTLSIIMALLIWDSVGASTWWNGWSPNNNNDRYQRDKLPVILPTRKTEFKQLWYTILNGPIEATPTVYENYVYVPSIGGTLYCLQADNGIILWQKNLSNITNDGYTYSSRTSALIYNGMIILGLSHTTILQPIPGIGAYAVALNRSTGSVVWQHRVSSHPASVITSTPQLAGDRLFIGISSIEESSATNPAYLCCTFQGSVVALKVSTGQFLWETKMIPDNNGTTTGYSGKLERKMKLLYATL